MKNIINPETKVVKRVSDKEAFQAVNYDGFEYTTKNKLKSFLNRSKKEIKSQKAVAHLELQYQKDKKGKVINKRKEQDTNKIIAAIPHHVNGLFGTETHYQRRVLQY